MQYIPIKTPVLKPPQDDLCKVLDEALTDIQEKDIILISSKIVAIGEGNCIKIGDVDKKDLVLEEAELAIPREYWPSPLTIKCNAFIGTAGIDESNADGYFVLLPKDPFKSAKEIYDYIKNKYNVENIGVIITDSHSSPLRRGATGVSIGYWGFEPTINHVGEKDLFGRELKIEVTNLVDGIAAGANVVMGETDERQPIVIARGVPSVTYVDENRKDVHMVAPSEDTFRVLYQDYL